MKVLKISLGLLSSALSLSAVANDTAELNYEVSFPVQPTARSTQFSSIQSPDYHQEQLNTYWAEQTAGSFAGAHGIKSARDLVTGTNKVRVGVVDGGFLNTGQLTFSEGYNFVSADGLSPQYESPLADRGQHCEHGHGNAVATLIGASQAGSGVKGVAEVELVAARAAKCNSFNSTDAINAIKWLAGEKIENVPLISEPVDVINMSVGFENFCFGPIEEAMDILRAKGIPLIVSNGNAGASNYAHFPSDCPGVISVGSSTLSGFKSDFSNYGVYVDLMAHGQDIRVQTILDQDQNGSYDYAVWSGTSFSAPLVTGSVALLLQDNPALTPEEIEVILKKTAGKPTLSQYYTGAQMPLNKYSCDNGVCGYGILNTKKAVLEGQSVLSDGVALKNPLADECDVEFFLETVGKSIDLCSMVEFKLNESAETDNTKIEVYSVSSHSDLSIDNATHIIDSTSGSVMIPSADAGSNLAFRVCDKDLLGTYKCGSDKLTALSKTNLSKPVQCNNI